VKTAAGLGAALSNIMQLIPVRGSLFEHLPLVSNADIMRMRKRCESILPQMYHCRQCRADAAGTLDNDISLSLNCGAAPPEKTKRADSGTPLRFAVASRNGYLVDQHFGHTIAFYVYEYSQGQAAFLEKREIPSYCSGPEKCGDHDEAMRAILSVIEDCDGVIAVRIGEAPRSMLTERGIRFFMTYDYAVSAVIAAAEQIMETRPEKLPAQRT
jgi:predicted Fe-Mo cluster-binding NifX family protein